MVPHTRKKERRVICKEVGMKLITTAFLTVTAAFAQTAASRIPITDAEKIADALRAGPAFITKDATLLDWPSAPEVTASYCTMRPARSLCGWQRKSDSPDWSTQCPCATINWPLPVT